MCRRSRYIFLVLMTGVLLLVSVLLYLGWMRQESKPSGGTKFVLAEEARYA